MGFHVAATASTDTVAPNMTEGQAQTLAPEAESKERETTAYGGTPRETTGDHRGQFPRIDFGRPDNNSARASKSSLVWIII